MTKHVSIRVQSLILSTLLIVAALSGLGCSKSDPLVGTWKSDDGKVTVDFVAPNSMVWVERKMSKFQQEDEKIEREFESGRYGIYRTEDKKITIAWPMAGASEPPAPVTLSLSLKEDKLSLKGDGVDLDLKKAPPAVPQELVGVWGYRRGQPQNTEGIVISGSGAAVDLGKGRSRDGSVDEMSRVSVLGSELTREPLDSLEDFSRQKAAEHFGFSSDDLGSKREWNYRIADDTLTLNADKEMTATRVPVPLQLDSRSNIEWAPFKEKTVKK